MLDKIFRATFYLQGLVLKESESGEGLKQFMRRDVLVYVNSYLEDESSVNETAGLFFTDGRNSYEDSM